MWDRETLTKNGIIELLDTNDLAVTRAVIAIYKRQTADEQAAQITKVTNRIGFNQPDASYLSYCAQYALQRRKPLSGKHLDKARNKIKKYWKQLLEIANENEQRVMQAAQAQPKNTNVKASW